MIMVQVNTWHVLEANTASEDTHTCVEAAALCGSSCGVRRVCGGYRWMRGGAALVAATAAMSRLPGELSPV